MKRFTVASALVAALLAPPALAQEKKKGGKPKPPPAAAGPKAPAPPPAPVVQVNVGDARNDLFSEDTDRAAAAAAKLGGTKAAGALDALLDALSLGLHPKVASAALGSLANHDAKASLDVTLHYTRNRNPDVRAQAVTALTTSDEKKARAAIMDALRDGEKSVRAAACKVVEVRKDKGAAGDLMELMKKGDDATVTALAAIANPDIARAMTEMIGEAPDDLLAKSLGLILLRTDLGKETIYVQLVESIGRIPGEEALLALTTYIEKTPEKPPRQSRRKAVEIVDSRLQEGK
jgi:HEAT repeat protein